MRVDKGSCGSLRNAYFRGLPHGPSWLTALSHIIPRVVMRDCAGLCGTIRPAQSVPQGYETAKTSQTSHVYMEVLSQIAALYFVDGKK